MGILLHNKRKKVRKVVVYDSWTGNTKKIAERISQILECDVFKVNKAPLDLQKRYDVIFLGTPNIRAKPSEELSKFIDNANIPKYVVVFVTYGAPIWGIISSYFCAREIKNKIIKKGCVFLGKFICPGVHYKFKTYKNRPSEKDFRKLKAFLEKLLR